MAETLAEIVQEYDRREALMAETLPGEVKSNEWRARDAFARRHFARLVAVAKAAVEWDEANVFLQHGRQKTDADPLVVEQALARYYAANFALRAAVRGADEGGNDGR